MRLSKLLPLALCSAMLLGSCSDDNDENNGTRIPQTVENSFNNHYPNTDVKGWKQDGRLVKAEFNSDGNPAEAWFTYDGIWVKTEIKYKQSLPAAIIAYLEHNYKGFHINHIVWVDTPVRQYFELDMQVGNLHIFISISEDGTVIDIEGDRLSIPQCVLDAFMERYPDVIIKEWEKDGPYLKVEFVRNGEEVEAWFTYDGVWVSLEMEYKGKLSEDILDYIHTNYPHYEIDDIAWVETVEHKFFKVELELGDDEVELYILEDGTVIFHSDNTKRIPQAVIDNFTAHYPYSIIRKWEKEKGYYIAKFFNNGEKAKAWFAGNGEWLKTETNFHRLLPLRVVDFLAHNYFAYEIEEKKWIETPDGNYFKLELERGDHEVTIYVMTDGTELAAPKF